MARASMRSSHSTYASTFPFSTKRILQETAVLCHWYANGDFSSPIGPNHVTTFRNFAAAPEFLHGSEGVCVIAARRALLEAFRNGLGG